MRTPKTTGTSRIARTSRGLIARVLLAAGTIGGVVPAAAADPLDLNIQDQADYTRLIDSIRATEYVREDFLVRMRQPRIVAAVAALTAYAEINPNADAAQLAAFVAGYDATIQSQFADDPDLLRADNFMRALRFARFDDISMVGTATDTGKRAAALLGVTVPDPDNFSATQTRMVRFSQGLAKSWHHNPRFASVLLHGFFGVLPDGTEHPDLSGVMTAYLESQGFAPTLGGVSADTRFDGVNQSIDALPSTYGEYQTALNQPLASNPLVLNADATGQQLRDLIDARLAELTANLLAEPGIVEGQALASNASVVQQIVDDQHTALMQTSDERSLLYGTVILLGQSPLDELGDYAVQYQDYNASLLLATDNMAELNVGLGVASHLLTFGIGVATSDPGRAVDSFFLLVGDALGIANAAQGGSSTPSIDEQIYNQVLALRQQVEVLRVEMHERFDRIEIQLGFMYNQMLQGFNTLGSQIGDLQNSVDTILLQMNIVRSQLSRLEAALYGLAQDIILTDLTDAANTVLDYRDENNIDLAYADQNPSFITGSVDFFTFATNTARTQSFSGSRDAPTLNLGNASDLLSNAPVARYLNDLAVLPVSFGEPPLAFATVPAPEPWAQAASAYAQLARENPWYFAFRYEQQLANYNSDPKNESLPELDDIIAGGDQIVQVAANARSGALFDALIALYKARTLDLQDAVDAVIHAELAVNQLRTGEGSVTIDLWSQDGATAGVDALFGEYAGGYTNAFREVRWWLEPGNFNSIMDTAAGLPLVGGRLVAGGDQTLAEQVASFEYLYQLDANPEYEHRIRWDARVPPPLLRGSFATSPDFSIRYEIDTDPNPNAETWSEAYVRTVKSAMTLQITTFGPAYWYPIELYYTDNNDSRWCSRDLLTAGGSADLGWDTFMIGMPFGDVVGTELLSTVSSDGEFGDFSFLSDGGGCGVWNLTTDEDYDLFRVIPFDDSTQMTDPADPLSGNIFEYLSHYREQEVRPQVTAAFADQSSDVWLAAVELDKVVALINAYIELAAPEAVRQSEIIRSALRANTGASEIGLGAWDAARLVYSDFPDNASTHDPRTPGSENFDIHAIDVVLDGRADFLRDEIERALARPQSVPAYVGWMLDELAALRDRAFRLAIDDTYLASGVLNIDAASGVMANDTLQEYRTIEVDPAFGLSPANGTVVMNADGSFEYTPDAGFTGTDQFTYRLVGTVIDGAPNPGDGIFITDPATVVIRGQSGACSQADLNADGLLNFFDISEFIIAYNAQDQAADFTSDGLYNFFDISSFLNIFNAGCP